MKEREVVAHEKTADLGHLTSSAAIRGRAALETDPAKKALLLDAAGKIEEAEIKKDLTNADVRGMFRHSRLTVTGGGGILPSGPGPTASSAMKIADKIQEGKGFEQFKKEVSPVVWRRLVRHPTGAKERRLVYMADGTVEAELKLVRKTHTVPTKVFRKV